MMEKDYKQVEKESFETGKELDPKKLTDEQMEEVTGGFTPIPHQEEKVE